MTKEYMFLVYRWVKSFQNSGSIFSQKIHSQRSSHKCFNSQRLINKGRDIKVGIYDDIVNIVSPGSFPNTITATDIDNGRSEARNKVIANVFKELRLIEQWGSGINRIKTICKEKGLQEPKIQEQNDFVDVEFYRPTNEELNKVTIDKIYYNRLRPITTDYDRLNTDEQKVLKYLHENKKITRKDAVQLLGYGETKIKETLNILLEKELIIRIGQGRSTYYEYNYSIDN